MATIRIPQLPIRDNPNGTFRIAAWNPADDVTYGVILSSIITSNDQGVPLWEEDEIYDEDEVVVSDDQLWISQQGNNQGVLPGTDEDFWLPGNQSYPFTFWQAGIYSASPTLVFKLIGNTYEIFILNPALSVPYVSSDFDAELLAGDWIQLTNNIEQSEVDTSGATITLNGQNKAKIWFTSSVAIDEPKTWVISNFNFLRDMRLKFTITNADTDIQTFQAGVKILQTSGLFSESTGEWTPLVAGDYEAIISYDGTNLWVKIEGPYSGVVTS